MLKIRAENSALIRLSNLQHKISATNFLIRPKHFGPQKIVLHRLIGIQAEKYVIRLLSGDEIGEIGILESIQRTKISRDFPVKMIVLRSFIEFWYSERLINMETIL